MRQLRGDVDAAGAKRLSEVHLRCAEQGPRQLACLRDRVNPDSPFGHEALDVCRIAIEDADVDVADQRRRGMKLAGADTLRRRRGGPVLSRTAASGNDPAAEDQDREAPW